MSPVFHGKETRVLVPVYHNLKRCIHAVQGVVIIWWHGASSFSELAEPSLKPAQPVSYAIHTALLSVSKDGAVFCLCPVLPSLPPGVFLLISPQPHKVVVTSYNLSTWSSSWVPLGCFLHVWGPRPSSLSHSLAVCRAFILKQSSLWLAPLGPFDEQVSLLDLPVL